MKSFRTDVSINPSNFKIGIKSRVLTIGSCFADAIGGRLQHSKIQTQVNPFGVIYNPESIHKVLLMSTLNELPADHTYLINNAINLNYDFHSTLSDPDKNLLHQTLANSIGGVHHYLMHSNIILITYGTAWVYKRKDTGEIVANCHKMPSHLFAKSLLTEKEIIDSFDEFYKTLKAQHPEIRIILTLSPVRHTKDTLELNSVSKAVVRMACHAIASTYDVVEYFPAYEIMMDDLRDYRFYKSDMIHPSEEAEDYIWEKFIECYAAEETQVFLKQWSTIQSALHHKSFHPASNAHQQFLKATLKKLDDLKSVVDVTEEIAYVKSQLL